MRTGLFFNLRWDAIKRCFLKRRVYHRDNHWLYFAVGEWKCWTTSNRIIFFILCQQCRLKFFVLCRPTRVIATANRLRVSIWVTTVFGQDMGSSGRPKSFSLIQFDHRTKYVRCLWYCVRVWSRSKNVGEGALRPVPFDRGPISNPLETRCLLARVTVPNLVALGRRSNHIGVDKGSRIFLQMLCPRPLGMGGVVDRLETCPHACCRVLENWSDGPTG